jgi:hypothetical protein
MWRFVWMNVMFWTSLWSYIDAAVVVRLSGEDAVSCSLFMLIVQGAEGQGSEGMDTEKMELALMLMLVTLNPILRFTTSALYTMLLLPEVRMTVREISMKWSNY